MIGRHFTSYQEGKAKNLRVSGNKLPKTPSRATKRSYLTTSPIPLDTAEAQSAKAQAHNRERKLH